MKAYEGGDHRLQEEHICTRREVQERWSIRRRVAGAVGIWAFARNVLVAVESSTVWMFPNPWHPFECYIAMLVNVAFANESLSWHQTKLARKFVSLFFCDRWMELALQSLVLGIFLVEKAWLVRGVRDLEGAKSLTCSYRKSLRLSRVKSPSFSAFKHES